MNFISIGGWCGTKIALKELNMFNEPSLPFDSVRSSMKGVIDCMENDFKNYFPEVIAPDPRFGFPVFISEHIGFYHVNHNLTDPNVIESFNRKFARFDEKIKQNRCVFVRTIVQPDYNVELNLRAKFHDMMKRKYPDISYVLCYIIPNQRETKYYTHLDDKTFVFMLHHSSYRGDSDLGNAYKPIFEYMLNTDLFNKVSTDLSNDLVPIGDYLWLVVGFPMVNYRNEE